MAEEERYQLESAIKRQQNRVSESHKQIHELERRVDDCYNEMEIHNRVKDDHERFMYEYEKSTDAFIEMAASYNFVKKYEQYRDDLLHGPERKKAEEDLYDKEALIRKNIADTEEELYLEKRKAHVLGDQLDSLERDLSRVLQNKKRT
ncbi:MAG: hypothetical protein FWG40_06520 [Peptococcaceae bacterium]|nr:hypothetical protein [Peptococcaceae bacterium]